VCGGVMVCWSTSTVCGWKQHNHTTKIYAITGIDSHIVPV